jgi:membrane protein YqaA with SNARE-associated domain
VAELADYGLLLGSAFLSATLLPGSSEAVLIGLLAAAKGQAAWLILTATIGNVAGATVNWAIGAGVVGFKRRPWFPTGVTVTHRAQAWFARYGIWSLLLSWVPIVGDPLTLIAGVMRVPFWQFLAIVTVGKVARYVVIVLVWQNWGWA